MTRSAAALGATSLINIPSFAFDSKDDLTIKAVMDMIIKQVPNSPFRETVDTIKSGNADQKVTGIVTTMFATVDVIRKAIALKANFIIAHEPTFYNHLDKTDWLENDSVYNYKRELLEKNNIVVWRFHDYIHSLRPDGVRIGVMKALGWEKYYNPEKPTIALIPSTTMEDIIKNAKTKLGLKFVKVVGDLSQKCERIGLLPGAAGARAHIDLIQREKPDVLLCGEVQEWETSEYIRDARAKGDAISLVVLGHALSEEPGMSWLVTWLQPQISVIKVTHVPSNEPFIWV
jgi:putative NIF3 family GTP cyclohydrolase 1 type 2